MPYGLKWHHSVACNQLICSLRCCLTSFCCMRSLIWLHQAVLHELNAGRSQLIWLFSVSCGAIWSEWQLTLFCWMWSTNPTVQCSTMKTDPLCINHAKPKTWPVSIIVIDIFHATLAVWLRYMRAYIQVYKKKSTAKNRTLNICSFLSVYICIIMCSKRGDF